jgi:2-polyprenyl-3-methyl-5-hydroxy-6-metoxy-1,4-benzoquinol methylase
MNLPGWEKFWENQTDSFDAVMKISTSYFASQLETKLGLTEGVEIFDYGCGPGFLADSLQTKKVKITGADINNLFIEQCKRKHPAFSFILITTNLANNKEILDKHLTTKQFDFIILLSVAQYLKNIESLEQLLVMLCNYLKEDGKIVVADIVDDNTSSIADARALFLACLKSGKLRAFLRFMFYLISSDYKKLSGRVRLLKVPETAMINISKNTALNCKKINGLTLHPTRTSYILTKGPRTFKHE